jgi:uncharacterized protein (TIGR02246 family)
MIADEAIRNVIATWREAPRTVDLAILLELMTDDVVFLTPGQSPMDKTSFVAGFKLMTEQMTIDSSRDVQELVICENLAYCWSYLSVTVIPKKPGATIRRAGYTLSIFRNDQGK